MRLKVVVVLFLCFQMKSALFPPIGLVISLHKNSNNIFYSSISKYIVALSSSSHTKWHEWINEWMILMYYRFWLYSCITSTLIILFLFWHGIKWFSNILGELDIYFQFFTSILEVKIIFLWNMNQLLIF